VLTYKSTSHNQKIAHAVKMIIRIQSSSSSVSSSCPSPVSRSRHSLRHLLTLPTDTNYTGQVIHVRDLPNQKHKCSAYVIPNPKAVKGLLHSGVRIALCSLWYNGATSVTLTRQRFEHPRGRITFSVASILTFAANCDKGVRPVRLWYLTESTPRNSLRQNFEKCEFTGESQGN
jgi:hypothetical protein